jgi:hypothetical protein
MTEYNLVFCNLKSFKPTMKWNSASVCPNVVVEWLTHLFPIREVAVSNLVPETGYPFWGFRDFPQSLQASARIGHDRFLPTPFQFIIHLSPFHLTILYYRKLVLNKQQMNKIKHITSRPNFEDVDKHLHVELSDTRSHLEQPIKSAGNAAITKLAGSYCCTGYRRLLIVTLS